MEPAPIPTWPDTLFLLFSNTKVLVSSAVWLLVRGRDHLPHAIRSPNTCRRSPRTAKRALPFNMWMTHQGGFPFSNITRAAWADHALMRAQVCGFELEWPAGSQLHYHPRSAHYVLAMLIEAVTGRDYRDVIRERMIEPLGLGHELYLGVPADQQARLQSRSAANRSKKRTPRGSVKPACRSAAASERRVRRSPSIRCSSSPAA